jgi:predicted transporter
VIVIGPGLLFLIVALIVMALHFKGKTSKMQLDFEAEKARWERQNGRPYPYAYAELLQLWRKKQTRSTLGAMMNLVGMGISLAVTLWAALQHKEAKGDRILYGTGHPEIWVFVMLAATLAGFAFLVRFFFAGRTPPVERMMREIEASDP